MATQDITRFSSFSLTPQEQIAGSILTQEQKLVIQNLISERAELKLSLEPDDLQFTKQASYYAGQIEILEYLISSSISIEEAQIQY